MRNIEIFWSICVWCDIYSSSGIDSGVFPIGLQRFQLRGASDEETVTSAPSSQSPIKADVRGTSLLCHAHRTPLSVRQSCSPNKSPPHHPTTLSGAERCRGKESDHLTGKMRHLHQIINTLTGGRRRVLGEPSPTANISCRDEAGAPPPPPAPSVSLPWSVFQTYFPRRRSRESLIK